MESKEIHNQKPLRSIIHFHQDPWKIKTKQNPWKIHPHQTNPSFFLAFSSCWCPSDQMSSCNRPTTPSCSAPWVPCSIVAACSAGCRREPPRRFRAPSCGKWCVTWPWRLGDVYLMGISYPREVGDHQRWLRTTFDIFRLWLTGASPQTSRFSWCLTVTTGAGGTTAAGRVG